MRGMATLPKVTRRDVECPLLHYSGAISGLKTKLEVSKVSLG